MMKKPLLFHLQLILTSIAYNEAFLSPANVVRMRIHGPKTFLVASKSDDEPHGHTNGSNDALNSSIKADGHEPEISTILKDSALNETITEHESVTEAPNSDNESIIEDIIPESDEIKLDKVSMKEDLLANTSSAVSTLSISRSEELMEIIGGDIINKVNSSQHYFESSPPLSFSKYLTMQVHKINGDSLWHDFRYSLNSIFFKKKLTFTKK